MFKAMSYTHKDKISRPGPGQHQFGHTLFLFWRVLEENMTNHHQHKFVYCTSSRKVPKERSNVGKGGHRYIYIYKGERS